MWACCSSKFWDEEFAKTINFTGDPVVSAPDVVEIALREDDEFIILASDGLWDVVSSKDAVDIARKDLQKGRPLKAVAEKLANIALRRYSQVRCVVESLTSRAPPGGGGGGNLMV